MVSRKRAANWAGITACAVTGLLHTSAQAQDATFIFNGKERQIVQATANNPALVSRFYTPGSTCAPLCLAPMQANFDISTIAEKEVIAFLQSEVANGAGLLIDARQPDQRALGAIAASVNVPTSLVSPENPYLDDILKALGARSLGGALNFSDAMPVIVFDNGPAAQDAQNFITSLIATGYPSEKIRYYRGGMLVWTALGLNIEAAQS